MKPKEREREMHTNEIGVRQQQLYSAREEATKIGDQESLPKVKVVSTIEEGCLYM